MQILHNKRIFFIYIILLALTAPAITANGTSAPKKKKRATTQKESSVSVKKQQQSVQKEIKLTEQQIEENEAAVRDNLILLTNLEHDINLQNQKVIELQNRNKQINSDIDNCQVQINNGQKTLSSLRARYVAVIKKMRVARKRAHPLAYIFASKNFYQAWRRLRYLQKFNDWRAAREKEINAEIEQLNRLNNQLASSRQLLQNNLAEQQSAKKVLDAKHKAQDEAVKQLRSHGEALRSHLAHKQAEANALSAKVTELIAAEQAAAARREAERKAAEQAAAKKAAEKAAAEKAAARKAAEEKAAAEQAAKKAAEEQQRKVDKKDKKKEEKKDNKKQAKTKTETQQPAKKTQETSGKNYAEARGRKSRNDSKAPTPTPAQGQSATPSAAATGFAAAKGSLPRPVSGQFSIVSHFGRHTLPDLPDVVFDNPGIDAVVSPGASALAVYPGTVTGVYVLPGFSTVVIVSHGEYYTVYGNIGQPAVSKGDSVKQGQSLGKLLSDQDDGGRTTIHFEIYKNREKLNPEAWIR